MEIRSSFFCSILRRFFIALIPVGSFLMVGGCAAGTVGPNPSPSSTAPALSPTPLAPVLILSPSEHAVQRLKSTGVSPELILMLEKSDYQENRNEVVSLSVLGFLGKADYSGHYSRRAIQKCRAFIHEYRHTMKLVESTYGVPKEVIAALIWVETKLGTRTGHYSTLAVFFSLLQADHPEIMANTIKALREKNTEHFEEDRQKVIDRSYLKANWALAEIQALDSMRTTKKVKLENLKGSYAGAFGIPQFIPSSYVHWAKAKNKSLTPNLFEMPDAIRSVAHYLKSNGWDAAEQTAQKSALYHYNRAEGYGQVIQKIAMELRNSAK